MSSPGSMFIRKDISATDEAIKQLAHRYLEVRTSIGSGKDPLFTDDNPAFASLEGFSASKLQEVIKKNAKPIRIDAAKRRPVNDIYRSDLGEILLIDYFERECGSTESDFFHVPLKNLWDRELDNLPGRGYDALGYKMDDKLGIPILLLGEAKVSAQAKNPPDVVGNADDCIYNNHHKSKTNLEYLEQRLANYVKKVASEHKTILAAILFMIAQNLHSKYQIVYGCCLVRDNTCYADSDFGKMQSNQSDFLPGLVHFVIYCFDKKLSDVVDFFYDQIEAA